MSLLARFSPPSATTDQYDEAMRRLEAEGNWPAPGLEYHCCFLVDGQVRVSEVWDSREQFEAFGERLGPLLSDIGVEPGQPEVLEVYNVVKR
jgi:hypothetical protein